MDCKGNRKVLIQLVFESLVVATRPQKTRPLVAVAGSFSEVAVAVLSIFITKKTVKNQFKPTVTTINYYIYINI